MVVAFHAARPSSFPVFFPSSWRCLCGWVWGCLPCPCPVCTYVSDSTGSDAVSSHTIQVPYGEGALWYLYSTAQHTGSAVGAQQYPLQCKCSQPHMVRVASAPQTNKPSRPSPGPNADAQTTQRQGVQKCTSPGIAVCTKNHSGHVYYYIKADE